MDDQGAFGKQTDVQSVQDAEMERIIMSPRKGYRAGIALVFLSVAVIEIVVELTEKVRERKLRRKRGFQIEVDLAIRMDTVASELVQERILIRQIRGILKRDRDRRRTFGRGERRKRTGL